MNIKDKIQKFIILSKILGVDPSIKNFENRKKIQKVFYFLVAKGLEFDIDYKWYKYGPYSSELSSIYFQADQVESPEESILSGKEREIAENMSKFLETFGNDTEKLEFYASILFIWKDMLFINKEKSVETIEEKLKEWKPNLTQKYSIKDAFNTLKENNYISC